MVFYGKNLLAPCPNKVVDHPLWAVPRLLIQYIQKYSPYIKAVSSIRKPGTRHAVLTEVHITWQTQTLYIYIYNKGKFQGQWTFQCKPSGGVLYNHVSLITVVWMTPPSPPQRKKMK